MISYIYIIFHFRRIAGLNEKKAKAILTWREEHGAFINRDQLKEVKGIGLKSYEQCVGFVRIINALRFRVQGTFPYRRGSLPLGSPVGLQTGQLPIR